MKSIFPLPCPLPCITALMLLPQVASALPYPGRTPANKLTASDTENFDFFGTSVAASSNFALVGSPEENGGGTNRGSAYLFDLSTGTELSQLTASDAANNDNFGSSVALAGNFALVGAPGEDGAGTGRGAAYLFERSTGTELFKLVASDTANDDRLGISVALSESLVLVGAEGEDGTGSDRGAAYVFDPATGAELFKLTASDAQNSDDFASSVAISGGLALVGAKGKNASTGAAYLFDLTTGTELFKFTASDAAPGDEFGCSVALSSNLAVIGAQSEDSAGTGRGAVYVFNLTTKTELFKLTAFDAENDDLFGCSVAVSSNLALVGAREEDGTGSNRGAAYVVELTSGAALFKITAPDIQNNDFFGNAVSLLGNTAVIGASGENGDGTDRGAVYVFPIPDRRPDFLSGTAPFSGSGRGVFNTSGAGQTTALTSRRLTQVSGFFTLTGGGDTPDDCLLAATPGDANFALRYFRRSGAGESNATASLLAGTQLERGVAPGESGRVYRADVTPSKRLKKRIRGRVVIQRKTILARLTATSTTHDSRKDAAAISVGTR